MPGLLNVLPPPPSDKKGWPWTVETDCQIFDGMRHLPKISIVTPSYNQGAFLEETIRSVLLQNYANTELIIIDGGSTDSTLEVIKKYEPWIARWVSEKDRGQSHAINKGFAIASGDWIGWQNSDDIYLENAFNHFAQESMQVKADVFFGHANLIDKSSETLSTLYYAPFAFYELKYCGWNITNQSTFFARSIVKQFPINESLHYAMDADFYFRIANSGHKFRHINRILGAFRLHDAAKTGRLDGTIGIDESIELRMKFGIVQTKQPWNTQFRFLKLACKLRKIFYLCIQGNLFKAMQQRILRRLLDASRSL